MPADRAQGSGRRSAWRSRSRRSSPTSSTSSTSTVGLEKEGVERELQELLAGAPQWCGEGLRLVRREWPTDIGPVDLMCRDGEDEWIAVEIKRIATIDAVEQLTRYLERIRLDPAMGSCRGVLAAQPIKPQAACWRARAGSTASRSTSRCCAASASPSCACSPPERTRAPRIGCLAFPERRRAR